MKKNIQKGLVVANVIAVTALLGMNNSASAYTHSSERFYVNGDYEDAYRHIDDVYYFGDNHKTISIGNLDSGKYYNITLADISLTYVKASSLSGVSGGVISNIDISNIDEGNYTLVITDVASGNEALYSVVIDRTAPEFAKDTELYLDGRDSTLDYDGRGSVDYEFRNQTSGDIYGYNVYWENSDNNLVLIDTLENYENDGSFKPSTEGMGDYDRYDIVVTAFDRAFNEEESISQSLDFDSDDKDDDFAAYEDITNITVTAEFEVDGLKVTKTLSNGETLYLPNGVTPSSDVTFALEYDYNSKGSISDTVSTPSITSSKYSAEISLEDRDGSNIDRETITINIEVAGSDDTEDFAYINRSWTGSKVTTSEVDTSTDITNAAQLKTISPQSTIAYYKVGSTLKAGSVEDLLDELRRSNGTVDEIDTYDDRFNKTTYNSFDVSTNSSPGNVSFSVDDVYDVNPTSALQTTIELENIQVTETNLLFYEIIVNGTVVKVLDGSAIDDGDDYSFNYQTTDTDLETLNVELVAYYSATSSSNTVDSSTSYSKKVDVEQEATAYAYINYMFASPGSITASVSLFDVEDDLYHARMVLLDEKDNEVEIVKIEAGTTVYTFNNLTKGDDYRLQVQGESRKVDYGDKESILNGDDTTNSGTVPYTDNIEIASLGTGDDVEITEVEYDFDGDELEIEITYESYEGNTTDELELDVRGWVNDGYVDLNRSTYPNNHGDDLYEEDIEITEKVGTHTERFVIEGIEDDMFYKIIISDGSTNLLSLNLYPELDRPSGTLELDSTYGETARFEVELEENDTNISEAWIYVFEEGDDYTDRYAKKVSASNNKTTSVQGLDADEDYVAELRVSYKDSDGNHVSNELLDKVEFTLGTYAPSIEITNVVANDDDIYFDYTLKDSNDTFLSAQAVLYLDGKRVSGQTVDLKLGTHREVSFNEITANEQYEIRITMEYVNLNTDRVVVEDEYVNPDGTSTTVDVFASKRVPTVDIANLDIWNDKVTMDVFITDTYGAYNRGSIKVFKTGSTTPIVNKTLRREQINNIILDGLRADTDYEIVIDAYYEPATGEKEKLITLYSEEITTLRDTDAAFKEVTIGKTSTSLNVFVVNEDDNDIYFKLENTNDGTFEVLTLKDGNNKLSFNDLEENTDYVATAYYTNSKGTDIMLNSLKISTAVASAGDTPELEVTVEELFSKHAVLKVEIEDVNAVVEGIIYVEVADLNGEGISHEEFRVEDALENGTITVSLPYEQNKVKVYVNYENGDSIDEVGDILSITVDSNTQTSTSAQEILLYAVAGLLAVAVVVTSVLLFRKKH